MTTFIGLPQHIYIFAAILGGLLFAFVVFSLIPSFVVSRQLSGVIKKLVAMNGTPDDNLAGVFQRAGVLEHLWREYADSLHKQAGEGQAVRYRSTIPAGVIFRPDIVVDIPLRADFFKHLPGLFTGVGIIGTFYGLLIGMQSFVVSENTVLVRASLTRLLHGVSEAFLVSATAITLAMLVTFIEKLVGTRLNAKVEQLVQLLDGMFEGGAGEEYLARLVRSSEAAAAQTSGLLKGELKQILTALSEKQIAASHAQSLALGDRIVAGMEKTLALPLTELAKSLRPAGGAEEGLHTLLAGMFERFNTQMKDLFAAQARDMGDMQKQTLEALQATMMKLGDMAQAAGESGQKNMALILEQLVKSNAAAESRQGMMSENLNDLIEQLRLLPGLSQDEPQGQLQTTLNELSVHMGAVIDSLSTQVRSATEVSRQHQHEIEEQSRTMIEQFGGQVVGLVESVGQAVAEMKSAVTVMHNTTAGAMSALNTSADTLYLASKDFARASQLVTAIMDKFELVASQLLGAADTVSAASSGLSKLFGDYQGTRDVMIEQMHSLQALAEQIRREASLSGEVSGRIEAATARLVAAQKDADSYLSRISEVIGVAHQSFSEGMTRTVGQANREFHQALSDSVKLLREGIHELESTLDAATSI